MKNESVIAERTLIGGSETAFAPIHANELRGSLHAINAANRRPIDLADEFPRTELNKHRHRRASPPQIVGRWAPK